MKNVKEFQKKLNENPRLKAIFKLGIWIIFFIVVFLVATLISLLNPKSTKTNTTKTNPITKLEKIAKSNYEYEYIINVDGTKITLAGDQYNGIYRGYKETSDGIIKYQHENNHSYQIVGDYFEPIDNIYGNINMGLTDLASVIELIRNYDYKIEDNNYIYDIGLRRVMVNFDNKVTNVVISEEGNIYSLTYKNVNNVEEIKRISD